jgi:hypothetical protein
MVFCTAGEAGSMFSSVSSNNSTQHDSVLSGAMASLLYCHLLDVRTAPPSYALGCLRPRKAYLVRRNLSSAAVGLSLSNVEFCGSRNRPKPCVCRRVGDELHELVLKASSARYERAAIGGGLCISKKPASISAVYSDFYCSCLQEGKHAYRSF